MKINIEAWLEKHIRLCLIVLFVLGVLLYGNIAKNMTLPIYVQNDEDLYVNMARSFFYEGNFSREYKILNYNCVIYSIILSIAYFFYTPENILFIMRMIGIILVISSIFPAYLLANKMLKSKAKALMIAVITLIIPEMLSGLFLIQENLSYPMFLWIAYFVYCKFTGEKSIKREIIIVLLLVLTFFTKSYTIVFAVSYFLCLLIYNIKENDRKELHNTLIEGIIFCLGVALGYFIIYAINNFQTGTNHYSTQIMSIFPITLEKIGYLIYGIFGYLVFPIFSFGILPVLIPLFNYKEYSKEDKKFLMFIVIGTILTAIESALIVYIPEEAGKTFPAKICVRYLAVFMIPYILFFINLKDKNIKISKWIYIVCAILCTYLIVYSIEASKNFTYIDAFVFMFLSMLEVMRNKYASAIVIGGVFAFVFIWLELKRRKKINGIFSSIIGMVFIFVIILQKNSYIALFASNVLKEGNKLEGDYIKLAEFLKQDYDKIYAFHLNNYLFYGIVNCDYEKYYSLPVLEENTENKKVAVVTMKEAPIFIEGANKIDIGMNYIDVYVNNEEDSNLTCTLEEGEK